ncbi:MAG: hypothetical protein ACKOEO_03175, partial [Planctomycetaceae bacterium]
APGAGVEQIEWLLAESVISEPHFEARGNSDAIVAQSILLFLLVSPANRSTPAPGASSAASMFLFQIVWPAIV